MSPHHHLPDLLEGVIFRLVGELPQQGKEPGLLQGIHRVGAGRPVGANAEVHLPPALPDGPPPGPQFHVGLGTEGDICILPQQGQVPVFNPKAVGHDARDGEASGLRYHLEGGLAVLFPALRHLALRLGDMEVDTAALLPGRFHQGTEHLRGTDIGGMGTEANLHQGVVPVLLHQGLHRPHLRLRVAIKGEDRSGDVCPDAAFFRSLRNLLPMEVVVRKGGDPVVQHFGAAELSAPVDVLLQNLALVGPYLFVEPVVHIHIFRNSPKDVHGGMGMKDGEAGTDKKPATVQNLPRLPLQRG